MYDDTSEYSPFCCQCLPDHQFPGRSGMISSLGRTLIFCSASTQTDHMYAEHKHMQCVEIKVELKFHSSLLNLLTC